MTLRYLLDTAVVGAPVLTTPDADVVRRLEKKGQECAVPAPVWSELLTAAERLPPGSDRRATLERYLQEVVRRSFPVVPFDDTAAAWLARESARRARVGRDLRTVDGQIEAIAVTRGMALVTSAKEAKHHAEVPGLRVEVWGG